MRIRTRIDHGDPPSLASGRAGADDRDDGRPSGHRRPSRGYPTAPSTRRRTRQATCCWGTVVTDLRPASPTFFDELLPPRSGERDEHRRPPLRRPLAGHDRRRPGRAARLRRALARASCGAIDPATLLSADELPTARSSSRTLEAVRFQDTELLEERWDPLAWVYLLGGGLFPLPQPRVRAAGRRGSRRSPAGSRSCRRSSRRPGTSSSGRAGGRSPGSTPRPPIRQIAGIGELADEAVAAAEAAPDDPAVAALLPRLRAAADTAPQRPWRASRRTSATSSCRPPRGRAGSGRSSSPQKLRHTLRVDLTTARRPRPGRAGVRGRPRRDGPARPRALADLARRIRPMPSAPADGDASRRRQPDRPGRPRRDRRGASRRPRSCSTTAARRSPASRRSAATAT